MLVKAKIKILSINNTLSYKIHFYKYFFTRTQFMKTIISS